MTKLKPSARRVTPSAKTINVSERKKKKKLAPVALTAKTCDDKGRNPNV